MQTARTFLQDSLYLEAPEFVPVRLRGQVLFWAKLAWWIIAALAVLGLAGSLLSAFDKYIRLAPSGIPMREGWTPENMQARLAELGLSPGFYAWYRTLLDLGFVLIFFSIAGFIFWRKSEEWIALYTSIFLIAFGPIWITEEARLPPEWQLPAQLVINLGWILFYFFFLLFPDGRAIPKWMLPVGLILIPWQVVGDLSGWFEAINLPLFLFMLGLCLFAQIYRYRKFTGSPQRQQIKWIVFGFSATFLLSLASFLVTVLLPELNQPNTGGLLYYLVWVGLGDVIFLPIPISIGVAILRYRLWDIDIIVNRTLVYLTLSAGIVGLYVLIVGSLGALLQASGNLFISLVGAALVAILFQPLRAVLQRGVNRLMYGERDEPYRVISRLSQRLGGTLAPEAVISTILETVAQSLKLPYAAIVLRQSQGEEFNLVAAYGQSPAEPPLALPLTYQGSQVGQLLLAPRAPGDNFSPTDRRLLDDLVNQAGVAIHAVHLTSVLQRARERLVTAREEERRRVSRDLHDGFGPAIAGMTLHIGVARNLVRQNPEAAERLLDELKGQAQAANADIRRLVYAMRPPELDLGLLSALRSIADRYNQPGGMRLVVEVPASLPAMPAAIEVAAYRVAQEAVNNAVRHAGAQKCCLRLQLLQSASNPLAGAEGSVQAVAYSAPVGPNQTILQIEISDNGKGIPAGFKPGLGLNSMRERAEELGGTCLIQARAEGGTQVLVRLPFVAEEKTEG